MKQGLDKKKLIIRLSLVVVYAGLVMWVFVLGKGHSLIIDNKDLADGSLTAVAEGNLRFRRRQRGLGTIPRRSDNGNGQRADPHYRDRGYLRRQPYRTENSPSSFARYPVGLDSQTDSRGKSGDRGFVPLNTAPANEAEEESENEFTSPDAPPPEPLPTP